MNGTKGSQGDLSLLTVECVFYQFLYHAYFLYVKQLLLSTTILGYFICSGISLFAIFALSYLNLNAIVMIYIDNQIFDKMNVSQTPLQKGEYEECTFKNSDFSNVDLSEFCFINCSFIDCNLSLVQLSETAIRDTSFKGCKMLGIHFSVCNSFGLSFSFDRCLLDNSSFFQTKIKKTIFKNCQLRESDFAECDLSGALFDQSDLLGATFDHTNLEKADFRTSFNYSINPETNRIKKARFSTSGLAGLLDKYDLLIDLNA